MIWNDIRVSKLSFSFLEESSLLYVTLQRIEKTWKKPDLHEDLELAKADRFVVP